MSEIRSERVREIERYGESDREGQGEATRESGWRAREGVRERIKGGKMR